MTACSTAPVAPAADFTSASSLINQREFSGKQLGAVAIRDTAGVLNGMIALGEVTTSGWAPLTAGSVITPAAVAALSFSTNLAATASVATGAAISLPVVVTGGHAPYTYTWYKNGVVISGATAATYAKASAAAGDAGSYKCVVTDVDGEVVTSVTCVLSIT